MAAKPKIDLDELKELIVQRKTQDEIMEELGIKSLTTFKAAKLALFERDGKVYKVRRPRKATKKKTRGYRPTISKNGSLTLSAKMLEGSPFVYKDKFNVTVGRKKIILQKVD